MQKQNYYNDFFEIRQQKINFSFFELSLPDDDPVYTLINVMEELDSSDLLTCYSDKGRTGFNPIMLYTVVTYANGYMFVWRDNLNYHLANLPDTIDTLYSKYTTFLLENGYGQIRSLECPYVRDRRNG